MLGIAYGNIIIGLSEFLILGAQSGRSLARRLKLLAMIPIIVSVGFTDSHPVRKRVGSHLDCHLQL